MTTDTHNYVLIRDGYTCQRCGKPLSTDNSEIAHRICNSKAARKYIQRFAREMYEIELNITQAQAVLDHEYNLKTVCKGGGCNDSFNCFNKPAERDQIISTILYRTRGRRTA